MPRSCATTIRYGGGTINPRKGRFDAFLSLAGSTRRARLPTMALAKTQIDVWNTQEQGKPPPRALNPLEADDALRAILILPHGFTLTDAARSLVASLKPLESPQMPLGRAFERFIADTHTSVAPVTSKGYRGAFKRLARATGGVTLQGIGQDDVKRCVEGLKPVTKNNCLRNLSVFFNWCVTNGLIDKSPVANIRKVRVPDSEIHAFTVEQSRHLMMTCATVSTRLVAYMALTLFAGIRPDETKRLTQAKVGGEYVTIDGSIAKKRRRRTVPIQPNLRAWLDAYPIQEKGVYWSRRAFRKVLLASGLEWHEDICRHTFCTMRFEVLHDTPTVAYEAGNSASVLHTDYRSLASPGDGTLFFGIYPACLLPSLLQQNEIDS